LASRKTDYGLDIPLLAKEHRKPWFKPKKEYRASFVGRFATHPIRQQMAAALEERKDVYIRDSSLSTCAYVRKILASYLALAPRGYGGSSFRFYEAMQLGVVPILVGDIDTRPFRQFLDWESASFYFDRVDKLSSFLSQISVEQVAAMADKTYDIYHEHLAYQRWCPYVIKTLRNL